MISVFMFTNTINNGAKPKMHAQNMLSMGRLHKGEIPVPEIGG